ncbi:MAG: nascent polypeptide-associated complex protein [Candidatus Woesearchaeota archaeon]
MFPGGINPKQMQQAMKRMGIQQQEIDADEVIIRCPDKEIIIRNPSVARINIMGQKSYQISGNETERAVKREIDIFDEDIETVMKQVNCTKEQAIEAIKRHNGDLASAILELNGE